MRLVRRDPDKGYVDTLFWVPKKSVNVEGIKGALTFTFTDKNNRSRTLYMWQETQNHIVVPREFWDPVSMACEVVDCRPLSYPQTSISSKIVLDARNPEETIQQEALTALLAARGGILQLACGRGKTVIALELVARLGVPALIVVDNTQLLHQWKEEIERHLDVPGGVGLIQGDVCDWKKDIVLSTYQTLSARAATLPNEIRRYFGVVIWDEAHHVSAPVFSRSADLFYGRRYGLTATPDRIDGTQVVYEFHIGPVLYKNLTQKLKPRVFFLWTGLTVDTKDQAVAPMVLDKNNELHLSKLSSYFGQWRTRLNFILHYVQDAAKQGRKILVLSNSVDELANLYSLWCGEPELYSDIPVPTPQELGVHIQPAMLDEKDYKRLLIRIQKKKAELSKLTTAATKNEMQVVIGQLENHMARHESAKKIQAELERRQRAYIKRVTQQPKAGLLIYKVPPVKRQWMLKNMQVTFSIMKYGREGLDEKSLDTILVCEPMSQKNGLQQLMGRALREMQGKKDPVILFFEDDIGPIINMCRQLRRHLTAWPLEEGGPHDYTLIGHPNSRRRNEQWTTEKWSA